jgi:hypothetical protein
LRKTYGTIGIMFQATKNSQRSFNIRSGSFTIQDFYCPQGKKHNDKIEIGQKYTWRGEKDSIGIEITFGSRRGLDRGRTFWMDKFNYDECSNGIRDDNAYTTYAFCGPLDIQVREEGKTGMKPTTYRIANFGLAYVDREAFKDPLILRVAATGAKKVIGDDESAAAKILCEGVSATGEKLYFTFHPKSWNTVKITEISPDRPL